MPRPFIFDIPSLTGGLNESAPEMIGDNECAQLDNFYVIGPSVRQREGTELVASGYTEEILNVTLYKPSFDDTERVILGCQSSIARVNGTAIEALDVADGLVYPSSDNRWWFETYNDELLACQKGNGGVKRIYGDAVIEAGIAAPTVKPEVINGGAGRKIAGQYQLAYRYYNTITGARSNWSPLSKPVTIADNHKLSMSQIGVSTNLQVNARQIGATQPDGAVVYLVGQINDNVTTTFEENALSPDEYGEADVDVNGNPLTDTKNGLPPSQAWALEIHKERLFVLNKDGLFWSEPGLVHSFKATSFLPITKGTGLLSWEEHGLVITCEGNAQILLGDTPADWRTERGNLSREHGCPAGKSLAVGDGTAFWYTGVNIVASSGGAPQILPRIERIRTTLDEIPETRKAEVQGETIPSRGWYVLSVPTATSRKLIVYDYKASTWSVFPAGPLTVARLLRENQSEAVYAAFDSDFSLYEYLTGTSDNGTAITATLKTKNFGDENAGMQKLVRRVCIKCPQTNGTISLYVYQDGVLSAFRTGLSLNSAEPWKRFTLNTSGTPGAHVQVKVVYSGTVQLRIDQFQIEGVLLAGRRMVAA